MAVRTTSPLTSRFTASSPGRVPPPTRKSTYPRETRKTGEVRVPCASSPRAPLFDQARPDSANHQLLAVQPRARRPAPERSSRRRPTPVRRSLEVRHNVPFGAGSGLASSSEEKPCPVERADEVLSP